VPAAFAAAPEEPVRSAPGWAEAQVAGPQPAAVPPGFALEPPPPEAALTRSGGQVACHVRASVLHSRPAAPVDPMYPAKSRPSDATATAVAPPSKGPGEPTGFQVVPPSVVRYTPPAVCGLVLSVYACKTAA